MGKDNSIRQTWCHKMFLDKNLLPLTNIGAFTVIKKEKINNCLQFFSNVQ